MTPWRNEQERERAERICDEVLGPRNWDPSNFGWAVRQQQEQQQAAGAVSEVDAGTPSTYSDTQAVTMTPAYRGVGYEEWKAQKPELTGAVNRPSSSAAAADSEISAAQGSDFTSALHDTVSGLAADETAGPPRGTTMEERACDLTPANQCVQDAIAAAEETPDIIDPPPLQPVLRREPVPGEIAVDLGDSGLTDAEDVTDTAGSRVATAIGFMATGNAVPQTSQLDCSEFHGALIDVMIEEVAERTQSLSMTNQPEQQGEQATLVGASASSVRSESPSVSESSPAPTRMNLPPKEKKGTAHDFDSCGFNVARSQGKDVVRDFSRPSDYTCCCTISST